ncbi:type II secretion system F family protein [Cellulomonas soli]|uniref:Type II secretion system protein GspF domain-containing protein n=1 Tax=Cellulomonas soli TaxID=931535 RepID=A0A512PGF2_9CELL|nr:type II secretion system F family protein [Cellulomonas soli]NYI58129.1 hypothetical protein [Cellulomonas soli]GEP70263.1 hypothetical protein CSO01_29780 [Cellulomonas soli]
MSPGAVALLLGVLAVLGSVPWWWRRPTPARSASHAGFVVGPAALGPATRGATAAPAARTGAPDVGVGAVDLGPALLLELVDSALGTGAAVPRALDAVARTLPGAQGAALHGVASALALGAGWSTAWAHAPSSGELERALAVSWTTGAAPGPALRAAADRLRREARGEAREAAARLGVHLVLPLGLCFLPAFMLLGLVPVVISLAGGLVG